MSVAPSLLTSKADIASVVSFDSKVRSVFPAAREMKLDCSEAALKPKPAVIDKDGAVGFAIAVEIGSGERLTERRPEIRWRCETRPRACAFKAVLRTDLVRCESQRRGDDEFYAKRPQLHS